MFISDDDAVKTSKAGAKVDLKEEDSHQKQADILNNFNAFSIKEDHLPIVVNSDKDSSNSHLCDDGDDCEFEGEEHFNEPSEREETEQNTILSMASILLWMSAVVFPHDGISSLLMVMITTIMSGLFIKKNIFLYLLPLIALIAIVFGNVTIGGAFGVVIGCGVISILRLMLRKSFGPNMSSGALYRILKPAVKKGVNGIMALLVLLPVTSVAFNAIEGLNIASSTVASQAVSPPATPAPAPTPIPPPAPSVVEEAATDALYASNPAKWISIRQTEVADQIRRVEAMPDYAQKANDLSFYGIQKDVLANMAKMVAGAAH